MTTTTGSSSYISQPFRITLPLVLLLFFIYAFRYGSQSDVVRGFRDEQDVFVADVLVDGLDSDGGAAIADVCAARNWTRGDGVVFTCESAAGGPAQVRNAHLTCLRLAIEAGAEVVLPRIVRRPNRDRSKLRPNAKGFIKGEPMSYFWDEDHTVSALRTWCPQLTVHRSLDDLWQKSSLFTPHKFKLEDVARFGDEQTIADPDSFPNSLYEWLDREVPLDTRKLPLRIELADTSLAWPLRSDTMTFNRQFGALLRTRTDAIKLAGSVLFAIGRRFSVAMDPREGWPLDSFVGVDLRTRYDAESSFPKYLDQAANYLTYLTRWKLESPYLDHGLVAYLTNGAADNDVIDFRERASDFNITVVQAKDLLSTAERREGYLPLSWDQRALVDYEVVRRAGRFAGATKGEFAWDVAIRRRFGANGTAVDMPSDRTENVQFRDDLSILYGAPEESDRFMAAIWP